MKKFLMIPAVAALTGCAASGSEIEQFEHVHGLSFDQEEENVLYLASHHGLLKIDENGYFTSQGVEEEQHDLMGFTITSDNTMLSSGHPSHESDLPDPIGVIESQDQGETWQEVSLQEEVDFHLFDVNHGDEERMYGLNAAESVMYRSYDAGSSWDQLDLAELPLTYPEIFTFVSDPENADRLLLGGQTGIYLSEDAGENWEHLDAEDTIISAAAGESYIYAFLMGESGSELMKSEDFGTTWQGTGFSSEDDAVVQIAEHPQNKDVLALGTNNMNVFITEDGGENWETLAAEGEPVN